MLVSEPRCHSKKASYLAPPPLGGKVLFCQFPIVPVGGLAEHSNPHHDLPFWQTHRFPAVRTRGSVRQGYAMAVVHLRLADDYVGEDSRTAELSLQP